MNKFKRLSLVFASSFVLVTLLSACGLSTPTSVATTAPATTAATVSASHTWLIADPKAFLKTLPTPTTTTATPPVADAVLQKDWEQPVTSWINQELASIKRDKLNPPRAARALALLAVSMNDGLIVAGQARQQGQKISDDAVLAAAARSVLTYTHPTAAQQYNDLADKVAWVGVWQGRNAANEVELGQNLGKAIAEQVLTYAKQDGADQKATFTVPTPAVGVWQPTLPKFAAALEPGWGKVAVIGLPAGTEFPIAPPPAWDSADFQKDRADFAATQQNLTEQDKALAEKWAGEAGTVTPPGMWYEITRELVLRDKLDNATSARIYSTMGVAVHAGFCATWKVKYQYMVERPIQWMQESQPSWTPVIDTPPFPSYPSGHATSSAAAATVLEKFFPNDKIRLEQDSNDAAYSRIVGGIHWSLDSKFGQELGREAGNFVLQQAKIGLK